MSKKLYRAGVVPYYVDDNNEPIMMFMIPSNKKYGGDQPQIAKGKQEDNEPLSETAMREAEEELGLKRNNILNVFKVGMFMGRTEIYAARIIDPDDFGQYTTETKTTLWLTKNRFMKIGRDIHRSVIEVVYESIKHKEHIE